MVNIGFRRLLTLRFLIFWISFGQPRYVPIFLPKFDGPAQTWPFYRSVATLHKCRIFWFICHRFATALPQSSHFISLPTLPSTFAQVFWQDIKARRIEEKMSIFVRNSRVSRAVFTSCIKTSSPKTIPGATMRNTIVVCYACLDPTDRPDQSVTKIPKAFAGRIPNFGDLGFSAKKVLRFQTPSSLLLATWRPIAPLFLVPSNPVAALW